MAEVKKRIEFDCEIQKVWDKVTSLEDYTWRHDIRKIEVKKPGKVFIEHTKDGYATTFTITRFEPNQRYEFSIENANMQGYWSGIFSVEGGKTILDMTETVNAKKLIMKPFVGGYLKKQQAAYVADLKEAMK